MGPGFSNGSRFSISVPLFHMGLAFQKWVPVFQMGTVFLNESRFCKRITLFHMGPAFPYWSQFLHIGPGFSNGSCFSRLVRLFHMGPAFPNTSPFYERESWFYQPRYSFSLEDPSYVDTGPGFLDSGFPGPRGRWPGSGYGDCRPKTRLD